jgi:hypothetical protein
VTLRIVSTFEAQAPFQGLTVRDAGFGLHACPPRSGLPANNLRVPGPQVTFDWQWDFGSPAQTSIEPGVQSLKECQLRPVPDWVTGGVCTDSELEADDGTVGGHEFKGWIAHCAPLKATDLGVGHTDRLPHSPLAEACGRSRLTPVGPQTMNRVAAAPPAPVGGPFVRWHSSRIVTFRSASRLIAAVLERPATIPAAEALPKPSASCPRRHPERPAFHPATEAVRVPKSRSTARRSERPTFQVRDESRTNGSVRRAAS